MATDAPEAEAEAVGEEAEVTKKPAGFWIKFAAIGGLLVLVMTAQFVMLFYLFGQSGDSEIDPNDPDILNAETLDDTNVVEVDIIPQFNCTNSLSDQGQSIHFSFSLCVEVPENLKEQFTLAKKGHKNRIRQAVVTIIRNAGVEELDDPSFSTIKRQIREDINKILNQNYVTSVIITAPRKIVQ